MSFHVVMFDFFPFAIIKEKHETEQQSAVFCFFAFSIRVCVFSYTDLACKGVGAGRGLTTEQTIGSGRLLTNSTNAKST